MVDFPLKSIQSKVNKSNSDRTQTKKFKTKSVEQKIKRKFNW